MIALVSVTFACVLMPALWKLGVEVSEEGSMMMASLYLGPFFVVVAIDRDRAGVERVA